MDQQSIELVNKLNNVYSEQLKALEKSQKVTLRASEITTRVLPVYSFILQSLSQVNEASNLLIDEIAKSKLEAKLTSLVVSELETAFDFTVTKSNAFLINYVLSHSIYENLSSSSFLPTPQVTNQSVAKAALLASFLGEGELCNYLGLLAFLNGHSLAGIFHN